jgi:peptidase inhibitor family I36
MHTSKMSMLKPLVTSASAALALSSSILLHPAGAVGAPGPQARPPSSTQAALDAALDLRPGGVQVSDNAVSWDGGNVILVVPSPGQQVAPPGLGSGVREDTLSTPLLQEEAEVGAQVQRRGTALRGSAGTCPGGYLQTDYYCFYVDRDYNGRRLQFTGNTSAEHASNYGFNNETSSWVSNDVDCYVQAYDTIHGDRLWQEPENSTSSYVGNANNDKMSYWTCS